MIRNKENILWLDCIGALVVGAVMILVSQWISVWTGLPLNVVLLMAACNIGYGLYLLYVTRGNPRSLKLVAALAIANMAWLIVCIGIVVAHWQQISGIGVTQLLAEGVYVAALGMTEWRWRKFLSKHG